MDLKFEIFAKERGSRNYGNTMQATHPELAFIVVGKTSITFHPVSVELMQLKTGSEILFSKAAGKVYVSNVTVHSYIRGFKLACGKTHNKSNPGILIVGSYKTLKTAIEVGCYELTGWTEFDKRNNIEWYQLRPIKL